MQKQSPASGQNRPFTVVDYDPKWPIIYQEYKNLIQGIFGDSLLDIAHIGSTSIPGMFAKPNIDIYGTVADLEDARQHYTMMQESGFTCHGDYSGIDEEYFTIEKESGERIVSFHVFNAESKAIDAYKNFRDYLIEFEDQRDRYVQLKKSLYDRYKDDYQKYDSGKKELIDEIRQKAINWAAYN